MIFDEELHLEHISPNIFTKIKEALDYNQNWTNLQKSNIIFDIIKPPKILPSAITPGEYILNKLIEKLCTMGNLRDIFIHCKIYDALAIFYRENLRIIKQPTDKTNSNEILIKKGNNFNLEFLCEGIPKPKYHWYKNDVKIEEINSSELFYEIFTPEMEGCYYCIATQMTENQQTIKSNSIIVKTLPQPCVITKMPPPEICSKVGDPDIVLKIQVDGYPKPKFQWTHNNSILNNKGCKLQLQTIIEMTGTYRCQITNGINELIVIINVKITDPHYKFPICMEPVIEKVALLIGNEAYLYQRKLSTPVNDTKALEDKLKSIGFLVLRMNNLKLSGMISALNYFCKLCVQGSIVLFYYAGHGFEFGEKYLLPVDAPGVNYSLRDSVCEYRILRDVLNKKPKLLVTLLDMCLVYPDVNENTVIFEEKKEIYNFKSERNLIQGYSTATNCNAFEVQNIGHSIYNNLLQNYITRKIPIEQMLRNINHEFEQLVKGKNTKIATQMPTVTHNITKDYYLDVEKIGHAPSKNLLEKIHQIQNIYNTNI